MLLPVTQILLYASGAKFEVETCLHDVDVGTDAHAVRHKAARCSRRADQPGRTHRAEPIVVILDKAREPIQESVFSANPNGPAGLRRAVGGDVNAVNLAGVAGVEPSATGFHVSEQPVPRIPEKFVRWKSKKNSEEIADHRPS
jgi:hypothetical protein